MQDRAVLIALGWGALAAASLVLGALLALARRWPDAVVGTVLAFGAGALISSVAFELAQQGLQIGTPTSVAIGLALGAVTFFVADRAVERDRRAQRRRSGAGLPLALGALLDGIPEQAVLGIGLATGEGVSVALLVAIFVSNLPEGVGSAADMRAAGKSPAAVIRLWVGVAVVCALATVGGYALADLASGNVRGRNRRVRRRGATGDAGRLDGARGPREGRQHRRPCDRARIRRRRGIVQPHLTIGDCPRAWDHQSTAFHDDPDRLPRDHAGLLGDGMDHRLFSDHEGPLASREARMSVRPSVPPGRAGAFFAAVFSALCGVGHSTALA